MDEDELVNRFILITGIRTCYKPYGSAVMSITGSGPSVIMHIYTDGSIQWFVGSKPVEIQEVIDPTLSEEAKLEIILRYG